MTTRDMLILEMSTLTGVVTQDYEYLLSLLLRMGSKRKQPSELEYEKTKWPPRISCIDDLEGWFSKMEEIEDVQTRV